MALHGRDVGGHRGAVHVVHDTARAVGEREHRAHPINVGPETGEERLRRVAQQSGCPCVGILPGRRFSRDTRFHPERGSLEPRDRPGAAVLYDAQTPAGRALQDEVIAKHAAEGTGDRRQARCQAPARHTGLPDGAGAVAWCRHGAQSATR